MPQFIHQRRVAFAETDMAGIMHFANYYRFMEEVEHAYFRSLDLSIMHKPEGNKIVVGWPRVSAQCSFEAPIYYDDIIDLQLNVERIGAKSLTFKVEFYNGNKRVAHGRMKTACCLCKPDGSLESVFIPEHYLEKIKEAPAK